MTPTEALARELRAIYPDHIAAERAANIACALDAIELTSDAVGIWPDIMTMVRLRFPFDARYRDDIEAVAICAVRAYYAARFDSILAVEAVLACMGAPTDSKSVAS